MAMSERGSPTTDGSEQSDQSLPVHAQSTTAVGTYEVDDGVVFYDADNPLAWLESTRVERLGDRT